MYLDVCVARVTSASLSATHPACETLAAANASSLEMPLYAFASSCAFIADAVRAAWRATLVTASSKTSSKTSSPSLSFFLTRVHHSRASSCPSACSTFAHTRPVVVGASSLRRTRRSATTVRAKATEDSSAEDSKVSSSESLRGSRDAPRSFRAKNRVCCSSRARRTARRR